MATELGWHVCLLPPRGERALSCFFVAVLCSVRSKERIIPQRISTLVGPSLMYEPCFAVCWIVLRGVDGNGLPYLCDVLVTQSRLSWNSITTSTLGRPPVLQAYAYACVIMPACEPTAEELVVPHGCWCASIGRRWQGAAPRVPHQCSRADYRLLRGGGRGGGSAYC